MSRRDTIIIAVLVNAGLLMVLFATAMRGDKKTEDKKSIEIAKAETKEKGRSSQVNLLLEEPIADSGNSMDKIAQTHPFPADPLVFSEALDEEEILIAQAFENTSKVELAPQLPKQEKISEVLGKYGSVIVKKGDVLEKIAKTHGTSVAAIMEINNLSSTQLKIGQVLKVPGVAKGDAETLVKEPSLSPKGDEYYVVKEGDNPWMIATKNKVKWEDLLRLNNLDEQRARKLRPGDKLRLR